MIVLTPKQRQCLEAVRAEIGSGNVPTLRRLADRLSVKAITTVQRSLQKLEQRGAIRRVPGISGGIELMPIGNAIAAKANLFAENLEFSK